MSDRGLSSPLSLSPQQLRKTRLRDDFLTMLFASKSNGTLFCKETSRVLSMIMERRDSMVTVRYGENDHTYDRPFDLILDKDILLTDMILETSLSFKPLFMNWLSSMIEFGYTSMEMFDCIESCKHVLK